MAYWVVLSGNTKLSAALRAGLSATSICRAETYIEVQGSLLRPHVGGTQDLRTCIVSSTARASPGHDRGSSLLLPGERIVDTVIMVDRRVWPECIPNITRCYPISLKEGCVVRARPARSAVYLRSDSLRWTYPRALTPVSLRSSRLTSSSSPCTRHVFQSSSSARVSQTEEPSGWDWTCSAAFRISQASD